MRQSAIVTGGARGVGRAVVERLVEDGWMVAVVDADEPSLKALEDELGDGEVMFLHADPTDEDEVAEAFDCVVDRLGLIGGLVYGAGVERDASAEDTSAEMLREVLEVNFVGAFVCARAAMERMGATLSVVSMHAFHGRQHLANAAADAALKVMTERLAVEFSSQAVRVNAVMHGGTAASRAIHFGDDGMGGLRRAAPDSGVSAVVEAVALLLSRDAAVISGQTLVVKS